MKIKQYENKESAYWGVDFSRKPEDPGWEGDIEVQAIKGFEYLTVHGFAATNNIRVWQKANVRWRNNGWGPPDEAYEFAEQLRNAFIMAKSMDHDHGLLKSISNRKEYCKCGVKLPCDRYACNSEEQI